MNDYLESHKKAWLDNILMPKGYGKQWALDIARGTDTRPESNIWNGYPYIAELLILANEALKESAV